MSFADAGFHIMALDSLNAFDRVPSTARLDKEQPTTELEFVGRLTMRRVWLSVVGLLLITMPSFGQSKSADSQTLESILEQVRQLRHDLQTTTVAAQKAQILIHRVDAEESVVRVMQDRVDTARSGLAQIRFDQKKRADTI